MGSIKLNIPIESKMNKELVYVTEERHLCVTVFIIHYIELVIVN